MNIFIYTLIFIVLGTRLVGIFDSSLDLDEMATAAWAMSSSVASTLKLLFNEWEGNSAGYPVFIHYWGQLNLTEWWLRIPSVLASMVLVGLFYFRHSRANHQLAVFIGSLFLVFNSLLFHYSQNARVFILYALFCYLSFLRAEKIKEEPSQRRHFLWLAISLAISFYLFHFSILYGIMILSFVFKHTYTHKQLKHFCYLIIFLAISYLPQAALLAHQISNGPRWIEPLSVSQVYDALMSLIHVQSLELTLFFMICASLGLWICIQKKNWDLLMWTFLPLVAVIVLSLIWRPLLVPRYLLPSVIGVALLITIGINSMKWSTPVMGLLACGILVMGLYRLNAYYLKAPSTDFKGVAKYLNLNRDLCSNHVITHPQLLVRWPFYLDQKFELRSWDEKQIQGPYWVINGAYPLPQESEAWFSKSQESTLVFFTHNAFAKCITAAL